MDDFWFPEVSLGRIVMVNNAKKETASKIRRLLGDKYFLLTLVWIPVTAFLVSGMYLRLLPLNIRLGSFFVAHWLGIAGTIFIAVFTPVFCILKRRSPKRYRTLLGVHVTGNLVSVTFIGIHFAQQVRRWPNIQLATGIALGAMLILQASTGVVGRFQIGGSLRRYWRFIHTALPLTFYLVIIIHVLHGLGFL